MLTYITLQILAWILGLVGVVFLLLHIGVVSWLFKKIKEFDSRSLVAVAAIFLAVVVLVVAKNPHPPQFALPPYMQTKAPHGPNAALPIYKLTQFFKEYSNFKQIDDIGADPNDVPPPINRDYSELVKVSLHAKEVIAEVGDGVFFNYWTYNEQVPGPMLRVREGDEVEITLTNDPSSLHKHNIDLHAVTGPGGGATLSVVYPGETKTFRWKALQPGLYVYHCATPNISTHNAHGQYGMILVEPKEGLSPVDKEFYIMQGELYTIGGLGAKGLVAFDAEALLNEIPSYITFNGKLEEAPRMKVNTGDKVRFYVGNGGTGLISSFHIIGEIFDTVYQEAAIGSEPHRNVQTTTVLPGGASIVELTADVPGNYILVDHALSRMNKGAWAIMEVEGEDNPDIYRAVEN
jgi:nitrite reductase (NO-forming)